MVEALFDPRRRGDLQNAVRKGELARYIRKRKADEERPAERASGWERPLIASIKDRSVESVMESVEKGADLNMPVDGKTALMHAAQLYNDIHLWAGQGWKPGAPDTIEGLIDRMERISEILVSNGADPAAIGKAGKNVFEMFPELLPPAIEKLRPHK